MLVKLDSFSHYNTSQITEKWTQIYDGQYAPNAANVTIEDGWGRPGAGAMVMTCHGITGYDIAGPVGQVVPASDTYYTGFRFTSEGDGGWAPTLGGRSYYPWVGANSLNPRGHHHIVQFRYAEAAHLTVVPTTAGCFEFWKGQYMPDEYRVMLGVADFAAQWGRTYYFEFGIKISGGAGWVEFRCDGDVWFRFDGNTLYEGEDDRSDPAQPIPALCHEITYLKKSEGTGSIGIGMSSGDVGRWIMQDLYIANGETDDGRSPLVDFWGDHRIDYLAPTADGNYTDWQPSHSGEHYVEVDDNPNDANVSYNGSWVIGDRDSFDHEPSPVPGVNIDAIQVIYSARRAMGGPSKTAAFIRVAGEDFDGDDLGNATSYIFQYEIWENVTHSGESPVVITESIFNAMEIGYQKTV